MGVGLALEPDITIGLQGIAIAQEQNEPLSGIPDEERQIEQFALLTDMDELMVQVALAKRYLGEDELTQRDGNEILAKRNVPVFNDSYQCYCAKF